MQPRFAFFVGAIAALLIGASLNVSSADARGFEASDETVAQAKLSAPDDDRSAVEKRGGKKPKRVKPSERGRGGGPPSWAPAYGRRARSTVEADTSARSNDQRDDRTGRSGSSNVALTTVSDAGLIWPVTGQRLTTRFSGRHDGIDIGVSYVAVSAAAAGEVVFVGGHPRKGYGRYTSRCSARTATSPVTPTSRASPCASVTASNGAR